MQCTLGGHVCTFKCFRASIRCDGESTAWLCRGWKVWCWWSVGEHCHCFTPRCTPPRAAPHPYPHPRNSRRSQATRVHSLVHCGKKKDIYSLAFFGRMGWWIVSCLRNMNSCISHSCLSIETFFAGENKTLRTDISTVFSFSFLYMLLFS